MIPKPTEVKPLENYCLFLLYDNGERRIFDVTPYITGSWYGQLKNLDVFRTVHISGRTVEWADGQDIAPHELYELSTLAE